MEKLPKGIAHPLGLRTAPLHVLGLGLAADPPELTVRL
jgi:hypothetical protein